MGSSRRSVTYSLARILLRTARIIKRIRHARRFKKVLRPLFPGYVFVRVAPDRQRWRPILSTYGVRTLIRFGSDIALLDDTFILGLKAREEGDEVNASVSGGADTPTARSKL